MNSKKCQNACGCTHTHTQAILWKGGAYVLNLAPLLNLQEMEVQC